MGAASCAASVRPTPSSEKETVMIFPNYDKTPDSPQFAEGELGIKICFAGSKSAIVLPENGPWPLFGGYMAGRDIIEEFTEDIDAHVLLAVTHKESRGIFAGGILKDEPLARLTPPEPETGGMKMTAGSYFAVDLRQQCRIPGQKGKYWVIVLLGRMTSPVLEFEVR